ncbi:hypothetical protein P389DRAFT_191138 [Cystobasidium minutum MCA 4210]|uniref:uncharacterized protein n=1 Tax=Cystobasidium minutum MCA 4210 TaxID=1397322 RepID=UPI0034CE8869|eukprot:jgi/Rhomi1/191138/estExt_fgenesh1_pg.C_70123
MRFQQELQQMLQVQSLPSLSHSTLAYLEACLQASLLDLVARLKYILRRYSATPGATPSAIPYGSLVLLLHLHNQPRFYRLASFLGLEEARKKAKESASGVSELDLLNENDDTANDGGELFDDAWLGGSSAAGAPSASTSGATGVASSITDLSPATLPQAFLATSVFSTYGDDLVGVSPAPNTSDDGPEAILRRSLPPGFLEHIQRLQAMDAVTVNMSPSEYIQYSESRAQAGFTHHKVRSKRFRDFVTPLVTAHDIPINDELLDILGFLAHEIVFDHIEQGKVAARKRINAQRRLDLRARKAAAQGASQAVSEKEQGSRGKAGKKASNKGTSAVGKKNTKMSQKEKKAKEEEDKKKELERLEQLKIEEQNRHPDGPFSAPAGSNMTHGMPVPIHCPADIDGPLEIPDDPAVEHSKVDNTTTHANIASAYDVLLGDFEEAFHASQREGTDRIAPQRQRRRFVDLFR